LSRFELDYRPTVVQESSLFEPLGPNPGSIPAENLHLRRVPTDEDEQPAVQRILTLFLSHPIDMAFRKEHQWRTKCISRPTPDVVYRSALGSGAMGIDRLGGVKEASPFGYAPRLMPPPQKQAQKEQQLPNQKQNRGSAV